MGRIKETFVDCILYNNSSTTVKKVYFYNKVVLFKSEPNPILHINYPGINWRLGNGNELVGVHYTLIPILSHII